MNPLKALLLGAALAVAGCEAQPVGTFDQATYAPDSPILQTRLHFAPGTATIAAGEPERARSLFRPLGLGPEDDILFRYNRSGSPALDAARLRVLGGLFKGERARVRVTFEPGITYMGLEPNTTVVEAIRYDRVLVTCPGNPAGPMELTTPLPDIGCANAINLATMAASPRDLMAPREFGGSDAVSVGEALVRLQQDKVKTTPLDMASGLGGIGG